VVDRDEITKAWGDSLLGQLTPGARSVFRAGRWMAVDGSTAQFAVPNAWHLDRAEGKLQEVEGVLRAYFGVPVRVVLVEDRGASAVSTADDGPVVADDVPPPAVSSTRPARRDPTDPIDEAYSATEIADMAEAGPGPTMTERVLQAFPGAEEVPS
jgi:hypothetical protein